LILYFIKFILYAVLYSKLLLWNGPFVLKPDIKLKIETDLACAGLNSDHVKF